MSFHPRGFKPILESLNCGRLEGWKTGRLEDWKIGRMNMERAVGLS
jgi:hypothetical protein